MQEQALILLESIDANDAAPASPSSTKAGTKASSASSPRASRTSCTARFSPSPGGEGGIIKGSGRSIPGLHLRDALDLVAKRAPACCSASAATPWRPALRSTLKISSASANSSPRSPTNCSPPPT
jgi:hypothetical protein